jgi:hypothetical protein
MSDDVGEHEREDEREQRERPFAHDAVCAFEVGERVVEPALAAVDEDCFVHCPWLDSPGARGFPAPWKKINEQRTQACAANFLTVVFY